MPQIMTFTPNQCHFVDRFPLWLISPQSCEAQVKKDSVLCQVNDEMKAQQWCRCKQAIVLGLEYEGEHRSKIRYFEDCEKRFQVFQELPSPFLVLSTTKLTMTGIKQMGVITRAKTMTGGGSLSSSVGQSLKNSEWILTKVSSTRELGHGIRRQSDISSVQRLRLLYKLQCGDRKCTDDYSDTDKYWTLFLMLKLLTANLNI